MNDFSRKVFRRIQRLCSRVGLEINYVGRIRDDIPERELYRPHYSPWLSSEWQNKLELHDVTSLVTGDRKYVLWNLLQQAINTTDGDVIECGVYRGGTAHMFARALRDAGCEKRLHLFDTFAGMPETSKEHDLHKAGDFSNTSLAAVKQYLSEFRSAAFYPGFIPETFAAVDELRFCFAHIDLDIYDAILAATLYVYDRIARGGFMVYDDFGLASCPGARKAVEEFFCDKPEVVLALNTGQCVIMKA